MEGVTSCRNLSGRSIVYGEPIIWGLIGFFGTVGVVLLVVVLLTGEESMETKDLEIGKRIVILTRDEVYEACSFYCSLRDVRVPEGAELFVVGDYKKATGLQFEYPVTP